MTDTYTRTFALDGIEIVARAKGGDGRTVEAYAAVFDNPVEITDKYGHYVERIAPTAFNRTLSHGTAARAMVMYNHGLDSYGKSGGMADVPIGKPVEVRADGRGLLTISRYNGSQLADAVLESIRNGDITAQSFRGPIFRSNPARVPKVKAGAPLPTVTRLELGLTDYGPTPTPAYRDAEIVAVRSAAELAADFAALDVDGRAELIRVLSSTPGWDSETAAILATPPTGGPGADDSRTHSTRHRLLRLRSELRTRGV